MKKRASSSSPDLDRLAPEVVPGIRLLPVVHERVEMAAVARSVLEALEPAAVAVELPTTIETAVRRAVARLPKISLVVSQEPGEDALVWTCGPGEPFAEALRWAAQRSLPGFLIDPDLPYPERHSDPVPDPYALWSVGAEEYAALLAAKGGLTATEVDRQREAGMAFHVRRAAESVEGGTLLVLVGAAHAIRLGKRLREETAHPFARVRRARVDLRHLHPEDLTGLLTDPPLAHAVWESVRTGQEIESCSLDETLSRKVSVIRFGLRVITGQGGEDEALRRRRRVAYATAAATRQLPGTALACPDRRALAGAVWRIAAGSYREQTGESLAHWQRRLFFDYATRCARTQGQLAPGLFEWVVAARGAGDDNLAWEVFDAARAYPWQEAQAEIETARVDGDELDLGTRKVRFRRRFFRTKSRPLMVPVRRRQTPDDPAEWLRAFDSEGICSYPPEDLVVEDYGRFLQQKAISILSAERSRTAPFVSGLLDGIDIRETLRNVHEERIYVEEHGRAPGEAGSVVVIFDRDAAGYPFAMTWLGEHDQESDMAFYSTPPGEQVVGPGILRATYGGFMLSLPRGRLFDVWSDRDYRFARDPAEVLVMAAVDYSLEKLVVHVAPDPPSERQRRHAAAQKKQLLHIPLAALSPVTLKKVRVVHLLAGRDKRAAARDYIW